MTALLATATTAKAGTTVTAVVNGQPATVQVARDLAVDAGDVLVVNRVGAEWFAVARVYAAATTPADPVGVVPPARPTDTTGQLVVSPVETRSYRPTLGWRTDNTDVYQGQYGGFGLHTGCVFYGTKPRSLAGATVTGATILARRLEGGAYAAQATTLRLMTNATRPAGAPTLLADTTPGPTLAVGATVSPFALPTSWGQALVDGTAGGVAVYDADGSPYVRLAGRASWSPAFTLNLTWQRSTP